MQWFVVISFLVYSLNITGLKVKNVVFATSCLKDEPIDLVFWVPYGASVVTFIFAPHIGQWLLLGLLLFFQIVCFFSTYKFWIWPSEKKNARYNRYFAHTHHIIKPREDILVPDTFHITIFLLLFVNLVGMGIYIWVG